MKLNTEGLVFLKNKEDLILILDKINNSLQEFQDDKSIEELKEPKISYKKGRSFNLETVFQSDLSYDLIEKNETIMIIQNKDHDLEEYFNRIGANKRDIPDHDFEQILYFSSERYGYSTELLSQILKSFGNDHPSYLIRDNFTNSFKSEFKNVVKIGNYPLNISDVSISEDEFKPIRRKEIKEMKQRVDFFNDKVLRSNKKALHV